MTALGRKLRLEALEDRAVPAVFGNAWADGSRLTLSFAPDGTAVSGGTSALTQTLAPAGTTAKLQILQAYQSWAAVANLNVGLVADGGQAFGTAGGFQGDSRFGDIRIGSRALADDVLAVTAPFNLFGTSSGDVVLNSTVNFDPATGGRDLFTVLLQESGHSFSVGNSADTASVMYEYYLGARTGLSAGDVASIQALYGARSADAYEGSAGNNTAATATKYSGPVEADITTANDVDCYKFTTPLLSVGTTVALRAKGLSLFTGKVEVLNAAGQVVASSATTDPTNNDVVLKLTNLSALSTYTVRVSGGRGDVFGVGAYRLSVNTNALLDTLGTTVGALSTELGLNDTLATATTLLPQPATADGRIDFLSRASLSTANDVDFLRVHSPAGAAGTNLVATVWSLSGSTLDPRVTVYDATGTAVPAQVLTNDGLSFTVQVVNATPNADYTIKVYSDSGKVGDYAAATDFRAAGVAFTSGIADRATAAAPTTTATLAVHLSAQMHFVLTAGQAANTGVQLTIRDAAGAVVFQLQSWGGDTTTGDVLLSDGTYTVTATAVARPGTTAGDMDWTLGVIGVTDPVGAKKKDPTASAAGGTSDSKQADGARQADGSSEQWARTDGTTGTTSH